MFVLRKGSGADSAKDRFAHFCSLNGVPPLKTITDFTEAIVQTTNLPKTRIPEWTKAPFVKQRPLRAQAGFQVTAEVTIPLLAEGSGGLVEYAEKGRQTSSELQQGRSDTITEDAMVTSDDGHESEEIVGKGKGRASRIASSPEIAVEEPLFLSEPEESDPQSRKRVLQDSPSRVETVPKRSKKTRSPSRSSMASLPSKPITSVAGINLGHLVVEADSPLTAEHVPGLPNTVSIIRCYRLFHAAQRTSLRRSASTVRPRRA